MLKKIGILGGTFNPIHTGHLLLAEGARKKLRLDCILFIPCYLPPQKSPLNLVSVKHRLNMVKLAVKGNPGFKVSALEIKRKGISYSVDTLDELHKIYKGKAKFYFIVGSDSLKGLRTWRYIDRLMELCALVAVTRPGYKFRCRGVKNIKLPTLPVSSTDIRKFVKRGRSIKHLVPNSVSKYITKHRLYK